MERYYVHPSCIMEDVTRFKEGSYEHTFYTERQREGFLHQINFFTHKKKILELPNLGDTNTYHLMVYMLSRFYFFDNGEREIPFYYPKSDRHLIERAFENLPPRFKRETVKDDTKEYVIMPTGKWYKDGTVGDKWIYSYLRGLFREMVKDIKPVKGKGVYISRSRMTENRRHIENEEEFRSKLKSVGFSYYNLEDLTFEEQARLFASADCVTGPHGAGLTWTLFCAPGTRIVEVRAANMIHTHFLDIAKELHLRYFIFQAEALEGVDNKTTNYKVNAEKYIKTLQVALSL
jgi:hypothetical protein